MASKKLSPEAQRRAAGRKPLVVAKPKNDDNARYGVNVSKPVSSVDASRIKDARKLKKDTEAAGGTYYSAYDTSLGNTEQSGYDAGKTDLTTKTGGGGSGRNVLNDYTRQLQALLTGGSYADPYNSLLEKIKGLYGTAQTDLTTNQNTAVSGLESLYGDQTSSLAGINTQAGNTINSSMDSLKTMLEGQANPYANLKAESVTPTAQLSSFLQGQNVGDQQTQDYAQVLNAQNAGSAGAFNNLASVMRSIAGANQQGAISDVAVQRDASTRQLANQNAAAGTQLKQGLLADKLKLNQGYQQNQFDLSKGLLGAEQSVQQNSQSQQSDLIKQLMAAIAKGGVPKKGKLF